VPAPNDCCVLLLRADSPESYYKPEAVAAFRDIASLSVVPYARTERLRFDRANSLAFTNTFQFYPWTLDKRFEELLLINDAQMAIHLLEVFEGQSFPEQTQASVMEWPSMCRNHAREFYANAFLVPMI
jgi:hypothetical protein